MDLGISGLASNFDWKTLVEQLAQVERAPQQRLAADQTKIGLRNTAYGSLVSQLNSLKAKVDILKDPDFFGTRATKVGDETIASAEADANTALGAYSFNITQLATASQVLGGGDIGNPLSADNNVSGLVLSNASFATSISAGTFSINGQQVTIATTDTLQAVFDKISTATSGEVTASYNSGTDQITLAGSGTILLGSAADTSNFLQVAKLTNNGTNSVTSSNPLGVAKTTAALANGNFATSISDGGAGAGEFKINGVSINFDAAADTLNDVISRINDSAAGVTAGYDAVSDRLVLTNKTTGDLNVGLQDVTGNFLAATKLSTGTLSRGDNLLYTVNNGGTLASYSNTITADTSGIAGLSVTALKVGTTTVEVASDTATIKTALSEFITEYNKAQAFINTQTASTTDAKGKVTAGVLAGEGDAGAVGSQLRKFLNSDVTGLTTVFERLERLGYVSNGNDDTVTLGDSTKLDQALENNSNAVKELFTNATDGIAIRLESFLERTAGEEGSLVAKQANLTKQSTAIDDQIAAQEKLVLANKTRMTNSFINMEKAQAQINQQLQFLAQKLGLNLG